MTDKLAAVRDLIARLKDEGIEVVCSGGAARDTYLGREPKDYDFVILNYRDDIAYTAAISEATGISTIVMGENTEGYVPNQDERGLESVFESSLHFGAEKPLQVQFLLYNKTTTKGFDGDPYNAVDQHDCDLNKAWFEDVGGRLVARVHPEFPSPFTGNTNTFTPGIDEPRKSYIRAKFPEFKHTF